MATKTQPEPCPECGEVNAIAYDSDEEAKNWNDGMYDCEKCQNPVIHTESGDNK